MLFVSTFKNNVISKINAGQPAIPAIHEAYAELDQDFFHRRIPSHEQAYKAKEALIGQYWEEGGDGARAKELAENFCQQFYDGQLKPDPRPPCDRLAELLTAARLLTLSGKDKRPEKRNFPEDYTWDYNKVYRLLRYLNLKLKNTI